MGGGGGGEGVGRVRTHVRYSDPIQTLDYCTRNRSMWFSSWNKGQQALESTFKLRSTTGGKVGEGGGGSGMERGGGEREVH